MSQFRGKITGWLVLTVTAFLFLPISLPRAGTSGRDFALCIQTCKAARQSCADQCQGDCLSLFPGNTQQQTACTSTCKNSCVTAEQECKEICRAIKDGTSPNNPS